MWPKCGPGCGGLFPVGSLAGGRVSRVNDVHDGVWSEEDFLELGPQAKLVYLWSFTNPLCGMGGIYKVAKRAIAFETGLPLDDVAAALEELSEARFVVYAAGTLFVRSRVKHIRTKSWQIAKSIVTDVQRFPETNPARMAWMQEYGDDRTWGNGLLHEKLNKPSGSSKAKPDVDTKAAVEKPTKAVKRKPAPPAADELPGDLPDRLHPVAQTITDNLRRVADAKGAKPVTLAAVGRAVSAFPDHDHERIASEFEHYWVHGNGAHSERQDIVQTYRRRLDQLQPNPAAALAAATRHLQVVEGNGTGGLSIEARRRVAESEAALAAEMSEIG